MRIRKTASFVLAVIIALGVAVPAFASGYGDGTTSGGSYTPPPAPPAPTADAPQPVTTEQVTTAAVAAIEQAVATAAAQGTTAQASVALVNVSVVPAAAIQTVFATAAAAQVSNVVVHLDAREGNTVLSRVYVDAAVAANLSGDVDFSVATRGAAVEQTVSLFERYFENRTAAVSLGQRGAYGADIRIAAKVDLSGLNTSSLLFYVYDKATNRFAALTPVYVVDANGYLHFITPVGGDIVITDRALTPR